MVVELLLRAFAVTVAMAADGAPAVGRHVCLRCRSGPDLRQNSISMLTALNSGVGYRIVGAGILVVSAIVRCRVYIRNL